MSPQSRSIDPKLRGEGGRGPVAGDPPRSTRLATSLTPGRMLERSAMPAPAGSVRLLRGSRHAAVPNRLPTLF